MLAIDANLWVAAFDADDSLHRESVEVFAEAARRGLALAGPSFVVLESVCALARRLGNPALAQAAGVRMVEHPTLQLEPMTEELLSAASKLGVERRLRGADALYAATAARLDCPLLSWDSELIARGGALSPREWLEHGLGQPDTVAESRG